MSQFPELTAEQLEKIRALEKELGDVCLLAVRRAEAMYAVEVKIDKNHWKPVDEVYSEIQGIRSYYLSRDDAKKAKDSLKSLIMSKAGQQLEKRPIRVQKLSEG
ncbi:MAG: hypothetical protein HY788_14985 [Deltaproteobacteria bacterium]|nr:hypothetical protein [Deltaproteobacteria bacterium]